MSVEEYLHTSFDGAGCEYLDGEAANIWVIDPDAKRLFVFNDDGLREADQLELPAHQITFTADQIFS